MASEFADRIATFLTSLTIDEPLAPGFEVLDPYRDPEVRKVVDRFVRMAYAGDHPRTAIWGINPGRFGAGVTGLSFTDPFVLTEVLGFDTSITGRREISAEFIWKVVDAYGGPAAFFRDFYLSALSPLGYIREGRNVNFYDDADFLNRIQPQILSWIKLQQGAGLQADRCVVLGTGRLREVMEQRLRPHLDYTTVEYLEHPRFIMQYRRRQMEEYVDKYVQTLLRIRS